MCALNALIVGAYSAFSLISKKLFQDYPLVMVLIDPVPFDRPMF